MTTLRAEHTHILDFRALQLYTGDVPPPPQGRTNRVYVREFSEERGVLTRPFLEPFFSARSKTAPRYHAFTVVYAEGL